VTGTPLRSRVHCYGSRQRTGVTNVNFGFKQFATAVGIYTAKKSFMPLDNISHLPVANFL